MCVCVYIFDFFFLFLLSENGLIILKKIWTYFKKNFLKISPNIFSLDIDKKIFLILRKFS